MTLTRAEALALSPSRPADFHRLRGAYVALHTKAAELVDALGSDIDPDGADSAAWAEAKRVAREQAEALYLTLDVMEDAVSAALRAWQEALDRQRDAGARFIALAELRDEMAGATDAG